ncbi:MAG: hypothetical protein M3441_19005, partial [Chloroflexota bacterium]|nr:hypothetical protein [Chloroflexota bacterium]
KKTFPIWIPIVVVMVLLLVGGVIAFLGSRPEETTPAEATATAIVLQESADATAVEVARNAADQTSTAVAVELQAAEQTSTAVARSQVAASGTATALASSTYDFIAHAGDATWELHSLEETGSFTATYEFDWFVDGDRNGFAIWRDNRYELNDGSTYPRFLEARPPSVGTFGTITACYDVVYPSGAKVQPTDRISGKIGHIKGDPDTVAWFVIFVTDNNEQRAPVFSFGDVHNYSEGVRAFDVPVGGDFAGQQINEICLLVGTEDPTKLGHPSWIDVKITR